MYLPFRATGKTHSLSSSAPASYISGSNKVGEQTKMLVRLKEYRKFMPRGASACVERHARQAIQVPDIEP